jgi:hypothetical protein
VVVVAEVCHHHRLQKGLSLWVQAVGEQVPPFVSCALAAVAEAVEMHRRHHPRKGLLLLVQGAVVQVLPFASCALAAVAVVV